MKKVIIIAEAGVNHNGDMSRAKELIKMASIAGADYVKFQSFKAENLVSKEALKADYQSKNTGGDDNSQFNMLKKLELTHENHIELINYCKKQNIKFLSTAFDVDGLEYLSKLNLDMFKCPSGEITNYPYLKALSSKNKAVILSTGMANLGEIEAALEVLKTGRKSLSDLTILHCNTEYPTPFKDVNLNAMITIKNAFDVNVGYSDHTLGIEVPIAAVALGAKVIEKHFTLDRNLPGPDHKASLEPDELKAMISAIRNIELSISANGRKNPTESEKKNKHIVRKSIHTKKEIKKGMILSNDNLIPLRPGDGISPMQWEKIVGKSVKRDMSAFEKLKWEDLI